MWQCNIIGEDVTDYRAYAKIFDNLLGFLLDDDRSARTYAELIEENRSLFLHATANDSSYAELVEPRELLFLLQQLDVCDRLYWAPRPYRRTGKITNEYLIFCHENSVIACLFCGFQGPVKTNSGDGPARSSFAETFRHTIQQRPDVNNVVTTAVYNNSIVSAREGLQNAIRRIRAGGNTVESFGGADNSSGGVTVEYLYVPPVERQEQRSTGGVARDVDHFSRCPLVWLEKNCNWVTKYSINEVHEPSKFGSVLKVLQRSQSRTMMTETEWSEFVKLTTITHVMGACEDTLYKLYRKLVEMKLERVEERELGYCPLYTVYYDNKENGENAMTRPMVNRSLACVMEHTSGSAQRVDSLYPFAVPPRNEMNMIEEAETVNHINELYATGIRQESALAGQYESRSTLSSMVIFDQLFPTNDASTDSSPNVYAIEMETARRAFLMHGFCVTEYCDGKRNRFQDSTAERIFTNSGIGERIMRQVFNASSFDVICIYCGYSFTSKLCDPKLIDLMYDEQERIIIERYLLAKSPCEFPLMETKNGEKWAWWCRKPGRHDHLALSPSDVLTKFANKKYSQKRKMTKRDTTRGAIAVWLSASLNNSHASYCIFKVKKRTWEVEKCPVCLMEDVRRKVAFSCGHTLCDTCLNDVRLNNCPVCRNGVRKCRIAINKEILL